MTLCRLPRNVLAVYLSTQIALTFAVMMTTDMASRSCYRWYCRDATVNKVFVHLFSMATIVRCFVLIGKSYCTTDSSVERPTNETTRCPFKRAMRYVGAIAHELIMVSMWIACVALTFTMGNDPAGFISIIVLFAQILQGLSVIIEMIRNHVSQANRAASSSTSSAASSDAERGDYQAVGPMFLPKYQDDDAPDAEKGHPHATKLGKGPSVDASDIEERMPRVSEDTVGDFDAENASLLK